MKILYVQDTDWISRNPSQHNNLAERIILRGHEIRVIDYEILWRKEGKKELFSKRQVFRVSRLLQGANHTVIRPSILKIPIMDYVSMLFTYAKEIKRQIREFQPDVIIGDCILTSYLAQKIAKKNKIPFIYYILDINHKLIPYRFLQSIGKIIETGNYRNADLILAMSHGLKEYVIQNGVVPEKVQVLTAGTDIARFDLTLDGGFIRKKYGINRDDLLLFFVGWIHRFNALKEIAMELAKTTEHNVKILIVGDGDGFRELQDMSESNSLKGRLILAGKKPYNEIPSFLAAADICLLPAYSDEPIMQKNVPLKMYDYVAMGKPVISTKLPGIMREFGEDSGIVYVEKPENTINKALELTRNGSIKGLGQKAREFAEQNSWEKITDEFEQILTKAAKEKHGQ